MVWKKSFSEKYCKNSDLEMLVWVVKIFGSFDHFVFNSYSQQWAGTNTRNGKNLCNTFQTISSQFTDQNTTKLQKIHRQLEFVLLCSLTNYSNLTNQKLLLRVRIFSWKN